MVVLFCFIAYCGGTVVGVGCGWLCWLFACGCLCECLWFGCLG